MKKEELLISIIVPVYNVADYLEKCINSLLGQTYTNIEILLVDDGSTDSSAEICKSYIETDKRVRYIYKENGGLSSARNVGLRHCNGEYIGFVDSDDFIHERMYEALLESCESNGAQIAFCGRNNVYITGESVKGLCPIKSDCFDVETVIKKVLTWDNVDCSMCDKLFKRSVLSGLEFPEGKTSEDMSVIIDVLSKAQRISCIPYAYYNYLQRSGSISKAAFSEKIFDATDATHRVLLMIQDKYPSVLKEARFCRVVSLVHVLSIIDKQPRAVRKTYYKKTKELRKELKEYSISDKYANRTMRENIRLFLLENNWFSAINDICCLKKIG